MGVWVARAVRGGRKNGPGDAIRLTSLYTGAIRIQERVKQEKALDCDAVPVGQLGACIVTDSVWRRGVVAASRHGSDVGNNQRRNR